MPPNTQDNDMDTTSFMNNFWSRDKTGMNQLLDYMKSTHIDLGIIFTIYAQRSQLEHDFGEKLLSLSSLQAIDKEELEKGGVSAAYHAISMELNKTATSHLDLAKQLKDQVSSEFEQKLEEYKSLLEKWTKTLDDLYADRQERTIDLLKVRTKYLKEHEISKGKSTPTMDNLKTRYKSLVTEVDDLSQEWNIIWRKACEAMQAMEEDRIEFLKNNVWEYANLASARLLVEDEWCETIRDKLEKCSAEQEIERCISLYGTGSKIPTTNEYVSEQKKKNTERASKAPTPPAKPLRHQEKPKSELEKPQPRSQQDSPKQKLLYQQEPPSLKSRVQPEAPRPKPRSEMSGNKKQPPAHHKEDSSSTNDSHQQKQYQKREYKQNGETESEDDEEPIRQQKPQNQVNEGRNSVRSINHSTKNERNFKQEGNKIVNMRNKVSDNMGSTVTRAQIKRKPLNKSFMEQNQQHQKQPQPQQQQQQRQQHQQQHKLQQHQQQQEYEQERFRSTSPQSSIRSESIHSKTSSDESLESLLKTFEVISPLNQAPPIATVSDEARSRRQPSEYKPDTGSIPSKRNVTSTTRAFQEAHESPPEPVRSNNAIQDTFTLPIAAPKSPRPPPQQIDTQPDGYRNQNYQPHHQQQQYPASPNVVMQQIPDPSTLHSQQPNNHYSGQRHYTGQQHMNQPQQHMAQPQRSPMMQPQRSPMMQPQRSPMMQPQCSPMMQPQRSPMMQPQRSPMMQPQRSPMMQPQRSPMIQPQRSPMMQPQRSPMMQPQRSPMMQPQQNFGTQRGGLPPPINIPTNYGATPQPSPSLTYVSGGGGVSPGGILPPPVVPYHQPPQRPTQYSDGRPILFWVRTKYDYTASDVGELSFAANTLIGIVEADMTRESWWIGAIMDEYRQTWLNQGMVPSNFMATTL